MAEPTKNILLRLDPADAARLQAVADVEGRSVSDVAREAIRVLIESRRKDRQFQRLLQENVARQRSVLEDLAAQDT